LNSIRKSDDEALDDFKLLFDFLGEKRSGSSGIAKLQRTVRVGLLDCYCCRFSVSELSCVYSCEIDRKQAGEKHDS
jgi:hypothetical protein